VLIELLFAGCQVLVVVNKKVFQWFQMFCPVLGNDVVTEENTKTGIRMHVKYEGVILTLAILLPRGEHTAWYHNNTFQGWLLENVHIYYKACFPLPLPTPYKAHPTT
jgi:hypothetical protein